MANTDITRMSFVATALAQSDPNLMVVDFAQLDKTAQKMREDRDAANPPKPEGPALELQRLRRELFTLTHAAKNTEIYANNKAGDVKGLEERLNNQLKEKKKAAGDGNLRFERNLEHGVVRLEAELVEARKEFKRAAVASASAGKALKEWLHHARLKDLQKLVG